MKKIISLLLLILIFLPNVIAITGEIGNARAIISREWDGGETLSRTILVRNPNDVSLTINLEPNEGIKDIVEIIDEEFILQPGEEKNARYNLKLEEEGSWNGKINVYFKPEDGSRVVLGATLIVRVGDAPERDEIPEEIPDDDEDEPIEDDEEELEDDEEDDDTNKITGDVGFGIKGSKDNDINNGTVFLIIVIAVIVIAAVVGSIFLFKR